MATRTRCANWRVNRPMILGILLSLIVAATCAADAPSRTLLGSAAVQRDLNLTKEQTGAVEKILVEMEAEIQKRLKAALGKEPLEPDEAISLEESIADEEIERFTPKLMAVLDKEQSDRFWQIGAQTAGLDVFKNSRVRRVLKLTEDQIKQMSALYAEMSEEVQRVALDTDIPSNEVQKQVSLARKKCMTEVLALLTDRQRMDFDALLGKPFDPTPLSEPNGEKPRSLTFIFRLSGQNPWQLAVIPGPSKVLALSDEQTRRIKTLAAEADKELTRLRLETLKGVEADFAELPLKEQQRVVRVILDGAAAIDVELNRDVGKILDEKQRDRLDAELVKAVGVRAIGSSSIAARLKLTEEQRVAFAKLTAEFERDTAPLRVVRTVKDFDNKAFDKELDELEKSAAALLTEEQRRRLSALAGVKLP